MRIALFVSALGTGGVGKVASSLMNQFASRGHSVDMLLAKDGKSSLQFEPDARIRIISFHQKRTALSVCALSQYLRQDSPDVLLAFQTHSNVVAVASSIIARYQNRLILTEHGVKKRGEMSNRPIVSAILRATMGISYHPSHAVIAVSTAVASELKDTFLMSRDKVFVIPNPVNISEIVERSLEPLNHPWVHQDGPPIILYVGRLAEVKNVPTLITAFNLVRRERDVRLVLIGDGPDRERLKTLVRTSKYADDVLFAGYTKNPYNWMRASSVLVLPSRSEGFGNVLVEAMACGTPVVSTKAGGPEEILDNGRWGRLVSIGDAYELADGIKATLEEGKRHDLIRRAREFDANVIAEKYLRVFRGECKLSASTP